MSETERVYVLGAGAIGLALAANLVKAGRDVTAVRTGRDDVAAMVTEVTVHGTGGASIHVPIAMISLAKLTALDGLLVVTAKSYANERLAVRLRKKGAKGPVVLLQNGIGVESPFLEAGFPKIYRCVLFATSQVTGPAEVRFRAISSSPIGVIRGEGQLLERYVDLLSSPEFGFRVEEGIEREIWKKGILNSVFNTICPLLETDNGIFWRNEQAAALAREIVDECLQVTRSLGMEIEAGELMAQLLRISEGSDGQFISTLQDIRHRRETEIAHLNLAIARIAEASAPPIDVGNTRMLGMLVQLKSALSRENQS